MAFSAFFRILFDGREAAAWARFLSSGELAPASEVAVAPAAPAPVAGAGHAPAAPAPATADRAPDAALLLLSLLQSEGRFVDFVQQDLTAFSDADVGAVARVVNTGCRKVLRTHLQIEPIRSEPEGQAVTLEPGFDPSRVKLTGNVGGQGRLQGVLRHRGWQAANVQLPTLVDRAGSRVLCPAEVEM
ncbi:MAG: hypothetical protein RL033_6706 [Pseudomonadota bacterium]|jgi:hypothetical protein